MKPFSKATFVMKYLILYLTLRPKVTWKISRIWRLSGKDYFFRLLFSYSDSNEIICKIAMLKLTKTKHNPLLQYDIICVVLSRLGTMLTRWAFTVNCPLTLSSLKVPWRIMQIHLFDQVTHLSMYTCCHMWFTNSNSDFLKFCTFSMSYFLFCSTMVSFK